MWHPIYYFPFRGYANFVSLQFVEYLSLLFPNRRILSDWPIWLSSCLFIQDTRAIWPTQIISRRLFPLGHFNWHSRPRLWRLLGLHFRPTPLATKVNRMSTVATTIQIYKKCNSFFSSAANNRNLIIELSTALKFIDKTLIKKSSPTIVCIPYTVDFPLKKAFDKCELQKRKTKVLRLQT